MKSLARSVVLPLFAAMLFVSAAPAQAAAAPAAQAELDQMLAPIALYPDSLLSQILMASTYPLEVVEAARWSKANPGLQGQDAVAAVDSAGWDPSVKALVAFPQVLAMMDEQLDWTERLGDVFIAQQPQVMATVQRLREKAEAAGNLRSSDRYDVSDDGGQITIDPASPEVVYVPYYDPWVVYGTWWWPAYPPVRWAVWPGYYVHPGFAFAWGVGITIGPAFFYSAFDWHAHRVTVVNVGHAGYAAHVAAAGRPVAWHHDPDHRHGVPYRISSVERQYGRYDRDSRAVHARNAFVPAPRGAPDRRDAGNPYYRAKTSAPSDAHAGYPASRGSYGTPHAARGAGYSPGYHVSDNRSRGTTVAATPQRSTSPGGVRYSHYSYAPRPAAPGGSGHSVEARGSGGREGDRGMQVGHGDDRGR